MPTTSTRLIAVALLCPLMAPALYAAELCTAEGMFGYRLGGKPGPEARFVSESILVKTYRVPDGPPPFTERYVRTNRANGEIISVQGLAPMSSDDAIAWLAAYRAAKRAHAARPLQALEL